MATKTKQKLRFMLVGLANTAIDFGLFTLLIRSGVPAIAANYVSTTVALSFSFFFNRRYTFQRTGAMKAQEVTFFLAVTLAGLWLLQPLVIFLVQGFTASLVGDATVVALLAKVVATVASLVWNYVLYSRVVFKGAEPPKDDANI